MGRFCQYHSRFCQRKLFTEIPNQTIKEEIIADIKRVIAEPYIADTMTKFEIESGVDAMVYTDKVDQLADHYLATADKMGYGPLAKVESQGASDASLASLVDIPVIDGLGIVGQVPTPLRKKLI